MTAKELLTKRFHRVIIGLSGGTLIGLTGILVLNRNAVFLAGAALVAGAILYGNKVLKCPACKQTIYGHVLRKASIWPSRFPDACPLCGARFDGGGYEPDGR